MTRSSRTTQDRIVSDGLGLSAYPAGTLSGESLDGHVMGVVALAWMTRYPVEAWGREWLHEGTIEMRFRRHLSPGRPLVVESEREAEEIGLSVRDDEGIVYASGWAALGRTVRGSESIRSLGHQSGEATPISFPVPPTAEALQGLELRPLRFRFDAQRDLAFVERLEDADFWRRQGAAHPAWLGSAANAITRHNVDFGLGGRWLHAGLRIDLHAPVADGAALEMTGRIESLFERRGRQFAVAALEVHAASTRVSSLRNTFVYGADPGP